MCITRLLARNIYRDSSKVAPLLCLRYRRPKGEKSGSFGGASPMCPWSREGLNGALAVAVFLWISSRKPSVWYNPHIFIRVLYSSQVALNACSFLRLAMLSVPPAAPNVVTLCEHRCAAHVKPTGSSAIISSPVRSDSVRLPSRLVRRISRLGDKIKIPIDFLRLFSNPVRCASQLCLFHFAAPMNYPPLCPFCMTSERHVVSFGCPRIG